MKPTRKSKLIDQKTRVKLAEELNKKGIVTLKEVRKEKRILRRKESGFLSLVLILALIAIVIVLISS